MSDESSDVGEQEVGYGSPPRHTRFKPGRSGNPKGRPRSVNNLSTDVRNALKAPIKLRSEGRVRNISTQEGALRLLREKALKGDARALDRLLEFAARFNNDPLEQNGSAIVSGDDKAILDAYAAEAIASAGRDGADGSSGENVSIQDRP